MTRKDQIPQPEDSGAWPPPDSKAEIWEFQWQHPPTPTAWARWGPAHLWGAELLRRIPVSDWSPVRAANVDYLCLVFPVTGEFPAEQLRLGQQWLVNCLAESEPDPLCHTVILPQTSLLWHSRIAVAAGPTERLGILTKICLEMACIERTLADLERAVEQNWEQVELDSQWAFEFNEGDLAERQRLQKQFLRVRRWQADYARIVPQLWAPAVFPPTLASQIAERLREKLRYEERLEWLQHKLETQSEIYELCSQRVSEYRTARTGWQLEWVIILLLLAQTLLVLIEILSARAG